MKERIKKVRKKYGLTQTAFADRLKISRSAVCKIESGENVPSEQTIEIICKNFNVNKSWLKTGTGDPKAIPEDERAEYLSYLLENVDDPIAEAITSFMEIYLDLDSKDRIVLQNLARKLLNKKRED